ncbi:MAG: DUF2188 domain-containing protein [Cupriavidus sp.]|nr:DUF2188 domain-containing protein [Cupriavidus sp.]NUT15883.1 DUF2188 domain-containing protein [Cupriavidus sp.]
MSNIHVVPAGGCWAVQHASGKNRKSYSTQEAAIAAGNALAQEQKVELLIHGRDGRIRARSAFGGDASDVAG